MSHEIDQTTGRAAIAYAGQTPWHKLGTPAQAGWSLEDWITNSGTGFTVERVQGFAADLMGVPQPIEGCYFNRRSDTGAVLGTQTHTDRRVEVQPREIMTFVHDYVSTDDRFQMQVMGAIKGGAQVWATAAFNGAMDVAGEKHQAFLLARTGFDGSLATHLYMTMVRAVCANTLAAGWDKRAMVSIRHTQKFDQKAAAAQLAKLAQSVDTYKAVGDALAQNVMAAQEVSQLFKQLIGIPFDAKAEDVSTRKMNMFSDLSRAYSKSVEEGATRDTAWAALQAVTRFADHDRTVRGDSSVSEDEKRFVSSQFGSGNAMKAQAMQILMPRIKDKVLIAA